MDQTPIRGPLQGTEPAQRPTSHRRREPRTGRILAIAGAVTLVAVGLYTTLYGLGLI